LWSSNTGQEGWRTTIGTTPHRSHLEVLPQRTPRNLWFVRDRFILSLQAAHRPPRPIEYYQEKLCPFVTWLEERGISDPAGIKPDHIRACLLDRERARRVCAAV
jgi:hypothetical protein